MSYSYRSRRAPANKHRSSTPTRAPRSRNKRQGEYIDPNRFIKSAAPTQADQYTPEHSFSDFALHQLLHANLTAKGYHTPSPIQDQTIPAGLAGQDIIGIASTGTGKTAAFALPLLQRLLNDKTSSALIIAPTRELAQQIEVECRALAKGSGLYGALLIGGASMGAQLRDLRQQPRIVIGTPGRIKDHLERSTLKLATCNTIVLDEVDRMLDMGFVNDVTTILKAASQIDRQSFFFSATIDHRVQALIETFTTDPYTISLKASSASDNVHQDVIRYATSADRLEKLHDLLIQENVAKTIIFDETQRGVERLNDALAARGFSVESIHGGKSQGQRQRALAKFKQNEITVLVATDVAARGIDVADITHVVNFSVPKMFDDYIHRIGRTGRAGRVGYALTFIQK